MQYNESSTLQLISGISNDLQKLFKYFNSTMFPVLPVRLASYLNEGALSSLVTSALLTFHLFQNSVNLKYQNNCHYIQLNCT